jgi:hypothetical protein
VMRRIVDGAIPVCAAIAAIPTALGLMPLPPSMLAFTGMAIARTWMATLAVSFTLISVGVAISKQRLDAAFWLEAIPFSYVGTIFALHVVALFAVNGRVRGRTVGGSSGSSATATPGSRSCFWR